MIDLHTHSLLSDGALLPSELVRRAEVKGYRVIGITDHVDPSNMDFIIKRLTFVCKQLNKSVLRSSSSNLSAPHCAASAEQCRSRFGGVGTTKDERERILALPGIELTHIPPDMILPMVKEARNLGAKLILHHGETLVEPVEKGSNMAAIKAGVDILTHPGLITEEETLLASKMGVYLEITTRKGHSLSNGHVANISKRVGAKLVLNSDAHSYPDLITLDDARRFALGAGLEPKDVKKLFENSQKLVERVLKGD